MLVFISKAHQIAHNVWVVSLLEHFNLPLDAGNLIIVTQWDDLDGHHVPTLPRLGLEHRAVGAPPCSRVAEPSQGRDSYVLHDLSEGRHVPLSSRQSLSTLAQNRWGLASLHYP